MAILLAARPNRRRRHRWAVMLIIPLVISSLSFSVYKTHCTNSSYCGVVYTDWLDSIFPTTATANEPDEVFSACLLVLDENFRLAEWLSYHYFTLPLRHVVIAMDPKSTEHPANVTNHFENELLGMTFAIWADEDYINWPSHFWPGKSQEALVQRHRQRQKEFMTACMKYHQYLNRTWIALWDVDEFVTFSDPEDATMYVNFTNQTAMAPKDMSEPGSVMKYIKEFGHNEAFGLGRRRVGTKETQEPLLNESYPFDLKRLDTIRFRYRTDQYDGPGKCMLNLAELTIDDEMLPPIGVHRPHEKCATTWRRQERSPFQLHHYFGSWEAYSRRDDPRNDDHGQGRWDSRIERFNKQSSKPHIYDDNVTSWLAAFVQQVGKDKAKRLLKDAGIPPSPNATFRPASMPTSAPDVVPVHYANGGSLGNRSMQSQARLADTEE